MRVVMAPTEEEENEGWDRHLREESGEGGGS